MIKHEFFDKLRDFFTSSTVVKIIYLITFTVIVTAIIASQNFFFQSIIENGISKRDIIAQKTADYFSLTVKDLKGTAPQQKVPHARHIAIYLAREVLQMSYESIGDFFDKKHTTIMYSCDLISDKLKVDNSLQDTINEIKLTLKN